MSKERFQQKKVSPKTLNGCVSPDGYHTIEYDLGQDCTDCGKRREMRRKP